MALFPCHVLGNMWLNGAHQLKWVYPPGVIVGGEWRWPGDLHHVATVLWLAVAGLPPPTRLNNWSWTDGAGGMVLQLLLLEQLKS